MEKLKMEDEMIIEVLGGCVEIESAPPEMKTTIIDHDNKEIYTYFGTCIYETKGL